MGACQDRPESVGYASAVNLRLRGLLKAVSVQVLGTRVSAKLPLCVYATPL
jgi:hypothetical protein